MLHQYLRPGQFQKPGGHTRQDAALSCQIKRQRMAINHLPRQRAGFHRQASRTRRFAQGVGRLAHVLIRESTPLRGMRRLAQHPGVRQVLADQRSVQRLCALVPDPARKAKALFQRFVRFDVWQVPTLTFRQRIDLIGIERLTTDQRLKYIPASIRTTWDDVKKISPNDLEAGKQDFAKCLELVAAMHAAGVPILAGTDTGDPWVLPGFALHDELALLVRAGMTPLEAIQTATLNPARFLGLEATQGTIQKGKLADLILLNANPLIDIQNTQKIDAVILKGRLLNRHDLNNLLVPVK